MTAVAESIEQRRTLPPVREFFVYENFNWALYFSKLSVARSSVLAASHPIHYQQWRKWQQASVCPRALWRWLVAQYGAVDMPLTAPVQRRRPFRLPEQFAAYLNDQQLLSKTFVEPAPKTVDWETHKSLVRHTMDIAQEEMFARTVAERKVEQLQQIVVELQTKVERLETTTVVEAALPTSTVPSPEVLKSIVGTIGSHPALSELERRLQGKGLAAPLVEVGTYAKKQFPYLPAEVKAAIIKAIEMLVRTPDVPGLQMRPLLDRHFQKYGATHSIRASSSKRVLVNKLGEGWEIRAVIGRGDKDLWRNE